MGVCLPFGLRRCDDDIARETRGGGAAAALLYSLESEHKILCRQRLAVTPLEIFPQGEGIAQAIGTDAVIFGAALGHGAIRQAAQAVSSGFTDDIRANVEQMMVPKELEHVQKS